MQTQRRTAGVYGRVAGSPRNRGRTMEGVTGPALRNTLSRRVEPVPSPIDGPVRMYTCGPTVYRWAHVGNLRSYLLADLIRRTLLYHGVPVLHVKNITDVGHLRDERFDRGEDRMLVAAGLESKTPAEIADAYEAGFHEDEALVNILPAHVFPRATEHVDEMLELAGAPRIARSCLPLRRGQPLLLGRRRSPTTAGSRATPSISSGPGHRGDVEPDKRDSADFALWKAAGEGRILRWPSPWGEGFPGWHLECSAMAMRYLGPGFEVHTGGIDNVFPHHEDEIAQSTPVTGGPPVRLWVHGEHLLAAGRKMAKSTGNFERVTELRDRGHRPAGLSLPLLTVRYGRKLNYSTASITRGGGPDVTTVHLAALGPPPAAGRGRRRTRCVPGSPDRAPGRRRRRRRAPGRPARTHGSPAPARRPGSYPGAPLSAAGLALHDRFVAAIDDDLDLPTALAVVRETVRADLPADERRWLVLDADLVLGLDLDRVWEPAAGPTAAGRRRPSRGAAALLERVRRPEPPGTGPAPTPSATSWRSWASR